MTQRKRLAVARFWYEGNAFCLQPAGREDFERREWQRGQAGLDAARGKATELAAVADFQDSRSDWEVRASRCASAQPAGPVPQPFFQAYVDEVLDDLRGQHWDAIYLSLHGACITDADDSPELSLLRAIRAEHPRVPIGASFDLHANIPPALPPLLSCSASYRTYPHIDMRETAARCLERLIAIAEGGIRPVAAFRNGGAWLQSANMRTDAGPMADLQALARARTVGPLRDIALHGGFPYANSAHSGASVWVWADTGEAAARALDEIYAAYEARFADFEPELIAPADGIRQALRTPGLVAVTDPADNPLSGGIGDTPALLAALLAAGLEEPSVYASLADPGVVECARAAGEGAMLDLRLGGRRTPLYGEPVALRARVLRYTDGVFVNSGPMETGLAVHCGPTVVLAVGAAQLIVTTHVAPCNDPAFFDLHGIDLTRTRLLCVEAKNHFRAAFAGRCRRIVDIDAPGPAMLDLRALRRMAGAAGAG